MITFIVSPSFDTKPKIIMITFIIDIIILSLSLSVCSILKNMDPDSQWISILFYVVFEINRLNPRRVCRRIIMNTFDRFWSIFSSPNRILFHVWWNIAYGSSLPSASNLEIILSECNHHSCFWIVFCLARYYISSVTILSILKKHIYIYIYIYIYIMNACSTWQITTDSKHRV